MRAFLSNLLAALKELVFLPFRWLGFGGSRTTSDDDAHAESAGRMEAVKAATAPNSDLGEAMAVRKAARALLRGETADVPMPVRRWLESLSQVGLAFVSSAKPDTVHRVLSGQSMDACPVEPFIKAQWDGTAIMASYRADRLNRAVARACAQPAVPGDLPCAGPTNATLIEATP